MPLGAARLTLLAFQPTVEVEAEVIRKKVGITAQGNAQIDTAQSKFGGASALFDGTGDYLALNSQTAGPALIPETNEFTAELWVRLDVNNAIQALMHQYAYLGGSSSLDGRFSWYVNTSGQVVLFIGGTGTFTLTGSTTLSTGTWHHLAVTRDSSNRFDIWVNGTSEDNTTSSISIQQSAYTAIASASHSPGFYLDGNIDEVRISDSARYTSGFTPSTTPFVNDDDTLLLLHMDGTDGSTHFEDDNGVGRTKINFSARNNAQIDTAQYKFGGSSAYFDGTNDWIEKGTDTLLDVATSTEFTYEMWIRPASVSGIKVLATNRDGNLPAGTFDISIWGGSFGGTRTATILIEFGSGVYIITGNNVVSANTWHHIACVRDSSNNIKIYVDGTDQTDYSQGTHANAYITNNDLAIGANPNDIYDYQGHIDEFRVSDVCRYTSNFTPATAPFVNDSNTLLLLHMDGTDGSTLFLDDNGAEGKNVVTETNGGTNLSTTQKKFGATSAFFDGDFDGLHMFDIGWAGADEVTVECWAYWTSNANTYTYIWSSRQLNNVLPAGETQLIVYSSGQLQFNLGSNQITIQSSTGALSTNTWTHLAVTKSGNTWKLWVNGSSVGSASSSQAITVDDIEIGQTFTGANVSSAYDGYIDEFRVSNTARYTASFTPATAPFTYDSNTLALLHMEGDNNGTVFNNDGGRQKIGVSAIGNAQIDTAQSEYGGSSALFDGTGDYLKATNNSFDFGTGDFTIECWVRSTSATNQGVFQLSSDSADHLQSSFANLAAAFRGDTSDWTYYSDGAITGLGSASTNTWYHIALVRSSGTINFYVDGTSLNSEADTTDYSGVYLAIGGYYSTSFLLTGNIDEFRISNSARYTSGFTAPTEPFQNDANTLLLLHMDGTDGDTDFVDDNGKEA